MSISFGSGSVRSLFKHHRFEAAEVQRQYVWGPTEQEALLNDLLTASAREPRRDYFLGALLISNPVDRITRIYDGQQRLTTAFLLLCALGRRLNRFAEVRDLLKPGNHPRLRIRSSGGYLTRCLNGTDFPAYREDFLASDWKMKNGHDLFRARLSEPALSDQMIVGLYVYLLDHVHFATVAADARAEMTGIFVRANARGRPLSWGDRLKSHIAETVMSFVNDPLTQEKLFNDFWYKHLVPLADPEAVLLDLARQMRPQTSDESAIEELFIVIENWRELAKRSGKAAALSEFAEFKRRLEELSALAPSFDHREGSDSVSFEPTPEQRQALTLFRTGENLKILAFAGAGKTATLKLMADAAVDHQVLYVAFNRRIVDEAQSAMPNTTCRTIHSLAYRALNGRGFSNAKLTGKINIHHVVDAIGLSNQLSGGFAPTLTASRVLTCLKAFCMSDDVEIQALHVPPLMPPHGELPALGGDQIDQLVTWTRQLWEKMIDPREPVALSFDGAVKLWYLLRPTLPNHVILVDEAKDMNPVALAVLQRQKAQLVFVGDPHQQIYEWRGAVDALARVKTNGICRLTQTFRFGPAIASEANKLLRALNESVPVVGNPNRTDHVGPVLKPDVILTRTNAQVFIEAQKLIDVGRPPHIIGRASAFGTLIDSIKALKRGEAAEDPLFYGFDSWNAVEAYSESEAGQAAGSGRARTHSPHLSAGAQSRYLFNRDGLQRQGSGMGARPGRRGFLESARR